ncbi:Nucleotide-binding universal stress protein, UspA family [Salinimicrobium catena]|uniref:Nucleotide-binding universal stress protein, UspA family n=1 Tax=Salinimicrobium catena TaxID=390640 RepID=A0A1H5M593_9FLAO|nr:universal stress protein [Salinimicrobium catena]SDL18050.1 Nucleotide-binding universal stress protein, UspA family [Salinimicrobium catena]SEE83831.1 Nucleotide-binding universal stress protein, UspA family [Salinimicrobium catena]
MYQRNRIFLLTDFSENSENLTDFAFELSEIIGGKVIFVHQVPVMAPAMADQEIREVIIKEKAEEALSNLRKLSRGRVYSEESFFVSEKPILNILKDLENEFFFDWVLAGLKSTGTLKRLFIGSTTLSIVEESDHLTVAVPARTHISVPKKLMVGVSPKYPLNKIQFEIVLDSLKDQIRELEFFTILKEGEDQLPARDLLLGLQSEYETHKPEIQLFKGEDALTLLKKRMEFSKNAFLVLQQGSRAINDKLFRKFMINELVYLGQIPLIVLSK